VSAAAEVAWKAALASLVLLASARPALAFSIASGFSEPCHEVITADAFDDVVLDLPSDLLVLPEDDDGEWRRVGRFVLESVGIDPTSVSETEFFVLTSVLVGVRSPDTEGHAILNLESARTIHTSRDPGDQYAHALRAVDDDGPMGDVVAVAGTRARILSEMRMGRDALAREAPEQLEEVTLYFDFYGLVELEVWAPAYHLGRAAHAIQDSFSHTIRDDADELHTILTVFNFVEAVAGTLRESRDGIAHSDAMDRCNDATAETRAAAREATGDLFRAATQYYLGRDDEAIGGVLDAWIRHREGCTLGDLYCDNGRWLELARHDPSTPYVCQVGWSATPLGETFGRGWLALLLVVLWRRRR